MEPRTNNYKIQAESARIEFLKWDQSEMISRFRPEHDDAFIYISFFNEKHAVNRLTGEVTCLPAGKPAGFNAVMTIYDILCYSKPGAFLCGEWQTIANLSAHSNFGASGKSLFGEAARLYSGKTAELKRACTAIGGIEATRADVGYRFDAFAFLPVILQFWDGDDEFEPRINFLFDANTLSYIHFETAWYVAEYLLRLIDNNM